MGYRIVVADDSSVARSAIVAQLERDGHTVVAQAADGAEAVRLVTAFSPDICALDLSMPVLDGIGAACEIRRMRPDIRLILITAYELEDHMLSAFRSGFDAFVTKKEIVEDLPRAVREVMRGGRFASGKPLRVLLDGIVGGPGAH
jgi:CheY-like chemotaxis protein